MVRDQQSILNEAFGHVPGLRDITVLPELLSAAPLPNFESLGLLLEAVDRLSRVSFPGLRGADDDWPPMPLLRAARELIRQSPARPRFYQSAKPAYITGFALNYGTYTALLDPSRTGAQGPERLRALLLKGAWTWRRGGHQESLNVLAEALRGLARKTADHGLVKVLVAPAAFAPSARDLALTVPTISRDIHEGLSRHWAARFVPLLTRISLEPCTDAPADPDPIPVPPHAGKVAPSPPPTVPGKPRRRVIQTHPTVRHRIVQIGSTREPRERGEPGGETRGAGVMVSVPQRGTGITSARVALFRATQNVWSNNSLLLTGHIRSLTLIEARAVGRRIVVCMSDALDKGDQGRARRWARVGLSLVTGRTVAVLKSLLKRSAPSVMDRDSTQWDYLAAHGIIRFPLSKLEDSFVPSAKQQHFFEKTLDTLFLPLPPAFATQLRRLTTRDGDFTAKSGWIRDLKAGCQELSTELGYHITPGRLRNTLSCCLQEERGDNVAAKLITGDSFGSSQPPLYYRAPLERDLQQLYAKVTAELVGGEAADPFHGPSVRVGAKSLLTDKAMRRLGKGLGTAVHAGYAKQCEPEFVALVHNALVDHVAGMILMTAGHRPADALFALTRGDFDTHGNGGLFGDKVFDLAHRCRFSATSNLLSKQIANYAAHLRALRSLHPDALSSQVAGCLAGDRPLLFRLTSSLQVVSLTLAAWSKTLPPTWSILPKNLGRTLISTLGPELGARAEATATTLGHLESVGYPFGDDGPTEPILLAAHLAPVLDSIARRSGWVVRTGVSANVDEDCWDEWGPLDDWSAAIRKSEDEARHMMREARKQQRAEMRSFRLEAEEHVLDLLSGCAPVLAAQLRADVKRLPAGTQLEILTSDQTMRIAEALGHLAQGDDARLVASHSALARLLKRAWTRWKWAGHLPAPVRVLHRPETSPFFSGMMKARHHIEALRAHFVEIKPAPPSDSRIALRTWDFARAALAATLFGFVADPEQVHGLLTHRASAVRSVAFPDLLLIQWGDAPCKVVGLRGLAAVAMGALAKRHRDGQAPSVEEFNAALHQMLPARSLRSRTDALRDLCATVGVTNRIELSGAARLALDVRGGSVSASINEQVSFIDGDPVGPLSPSCLLAKKGVAPSTSSEARESAPRRKSPRGYAMRQYKALLKVFPSKDHVVTLPRTGKEITPANIERSRLLVVRELKAWSKDPTTNNIVAALARWARKMLVVGTLDERNPAFSTVSTYLTTVGGDLAALGEGMRLADLDERELSRLFQEVVEIKPERRRSVTAREILHFHASVAVAFGLVEIEVDEFAEHLRHLPQAVDAEIIRVQEREAAIDLLAQAAEFGPTGDGQVLALESSDRRTLRQATVLGGLVGAAGARIGEPMGLRLRDVVTSQDSVVVSFFANRFRRLKTDAARRVVNLSHRMPAAGKHRISAWVRAEGDRLIASKRTGAFLFQSISHAKRIYDRGRIRDLFAMALATATGRKKERVHRVRHTGGTEGLLYAFLPAADQAGLPWLNPPSEYRATFDAVIFPRAIHAQTVVIGHARPRTTIRTYFHLPWASRARADAWIREHFDRRSVAVALGSTISNADRISQRSKPTLPRTAWLDHVLSARVPVRISTPVETSPPDPILQTPLSTREIGRLLGWTEGSVEPALAALAVGATQDQLSAIREHERLYALQMKRDFISKGSSELKARQRIRRFERAAHLYKLWDIADEEPESSMHRRELTEVVDALFSWARRHKRDRIVIPVKNAAQLRRLLIAVGHPMESIQVEALDELALAMVRVLRVGKTERFHGRELRRLLGVIWIRDRVLRPA